jgi:hypothetical protein
MHSGPGLAEDAPEELAWGREPPSRSMWSTSDRHGSPPTSVDPPESQASIMRWANDQELLIVNDLTS